LCRRGFALSLVAPSALDGFLFGHRSSLWMSRRNRPSRMIHTEMSESRLVSASWHGRKAGRRRI
jgi:hypothetical protein